MTPGFAFGISNDLTFAFFCNNWLIVDVPTTALLSLSHNTSLF